MVEASFYDRWTNDVKKTTFYTYEELSKNIRNLKQVNLILGRACNMNCAHCSQNVAKDYLAGNTVSDFLMDWLLNWTYQTSDKRQKRTIMFWGGEPLLYIKTIEKIVNEFKKHNVSNIKYLIFTNGKALNQDILDFMHDNHFNLVMSYDAPNPTLIRSEAPSEKAIELFNSYEGMKRINSIYTAQTPSLLSIYDYLYKIFPKTAVSVGNIRDGIGVPQELVAYEDGKLERDMIELFKYAMEHKNDTSTRDFFIGKFMRILKSKSIPMSDWQKYPIPYCGASINSLSVDLDGNVYNCHNGNNIIGNLERDGFITCQDNMLESWKAVMPSDCMSCPMASACGISCTEYKRNADGTCLSQCGFIQNWFKIAYYLVKNGLNEDGQIIYE